MKHGARVGTVFGMAEVWAAIGVSTTLLAALSLYLAAQVQHLATRLDGQTARMEGMNDRFDRVIEMLATHTHEHR